MDDMGLSSTPGDKVGKYVGDGLGDSMGVAQNHRSHASDVHQGAYQGGAWKSKLESLYLVSAWGRPIH